MICKNCGAPLTNTDGSCPCCGERIILEDGNGFWDLKKHAESEQADKPEKIDSEQERILDLPTIGTDSERKQPSKRLFLSLCAVVCVLCLIGILAGISSHRREILKLEHSYAEQLASQRQELTIQIEVLRGEIASLQNENTSLRSQIQHLSEGNQRTESPFDGADTMGDGQAEAEDGEKGDISFHGGRSDQGRPGSFS